MSREEDKGEQVRDAELKLEDSVQRLLEVIRLSADEEIIQDARAEFHWALKNLKRSGGSLAAVIMNHIDEL